MARHRDPTPEPRPDPRGCALHPVWTGIACLALAFAWVFAVPALRWLCLTVDPLIGKIFP